MSDIEEPHFSDLEDLDLEGDCDDLPLDWMVLDENVSDDEQTSTVHESDLIIPSVLNYDSVKEDKLTLDEISKVSSTKFGCLEIGQEESKSNETADCLTNSNAEQRSSLDKSAVTTDVRVPPSVEGSSTGGRSKTGVKTRSGPLSKRKDRGIQEEKPGTSENLDEELSSEEDTSAKLLDACLHPVVVLERIDVSNLVVEEHGVVSTDEEDTSLKPVVDDSKSSEKNENRQVASGSNASTQDLDSSSNSKTCPKSSTLSRSKDGSSTSAHRSKSTGSSSEKPCESVSKSHEKSSRHGESSPRTSSKLEHLQDGSLGKHSPHKSSHKSDHVKDGRHGEKSERHSHREKVSQSDANADPHAPAAVPNSSDPRSASLPGKANSRNHRERTVSQDGKHDPHTSPKKDRSSQSEQVKDEAHLNQAEGSAKLSHYHVPKLDRKDVGQGRDGRAPGKKEKVSDVKKLYPGQDIIRSLYEPPKVHQMQSSVKETPPQSKRPEEKDGKSLQLKRLERLVTNSVWGFELFEDIINKTKPSNEPPQWLLSVCQLTPEDLSQDELQNLITLSLSSQWVSAKSSGKRYGKLTLLYDSTKTMKIAMKSLLQIRPASHVQRITILRSQIKEKNPHGKDSVEFQLFTSKDSDISGDTVCVQPSISHGLWKGKVSGATLLMENIPASLERNIQADILQVLFPFAYLINVSPPSKGSSGCNAILKHRRDESVLAQVTMMRSIYIANRMQRIQPMNVPSHREGREGQKLERQESWGTPQTPSDSQGTTTTSSGTSAVVTPSSVEETQVAIALLLQTKERLEHDLLQLMQMQGLEVSLPPTPVPSGTLEETKLQLQSQVEDLIKMKELTEMIVRGDVLKLSEVTKVPSEHLKSQLSQIFKQSFSSDAKSSTDPSPGRPEASLAERSGSQGAPPHQQEGIALPDQPGEGAATRQDPNSQIQPSASSSFIPGLTLGKETPKEEKMESAVVGAVDGRSASAGKNAAQQQAMDRKPSVQLPPRASGDSVVDRGNLGTKRKMETSVEPSLKFSRFSSGKFPVRSGSQSSDSNTGRRNSPATAPSQSGGPLIAVQPEQKLARPRGSNRPDGREGCRKRGGDRHSSQSSRSSGGSSERGHHKRGCRSEPGQGLLPIGQREGTSPDWWAETTSGRHHYTEEGGHASRDWPEPRGPLLENPSHQGSWPSDPLVAEGRVALPGEEQWYRESCGGSGLESVPGNRDSGRLHHLRWRRPEDDRARGQSALFTEDSDRLPGHVEEHRQLPRDLSPGGHRGHLRSSQERDLLYSADSRRHPREERKGSAQRDGLLLKERGPLISEAPLTPREVLRPPREYDAHLQKDLQGTARDAEYSERYPHLDPARDYEGHEPVPRGHPPPPYGNLLEQKPSGLKGIHPRIEEPEVDLGRQDHSGYYGQSENKVPPHSRWPRGRPDGPEEYMPFAQERQHGPDSYRESQGRDPPPQESFPAPENLRRPGRRPLLPGAPPDVGPAEDSRAPVTEDVRSRYPRVKAGEGLLPLLPLPEDPPPERWPKDQPLERWPEEQPHEEWPEGQPHERWPEGQPHERWPAEDDSWRRHHPNDRGDYPPEFQPEVREEQKYCHPPQLPDSWNQPCEEPPSRRRKGKGGGRESREPRPKHPPPSGLLGHAPPSHLLQEAEPWTGKPGLLGSTPIGPEGDPREPKREALLGDGPEAFEAEPPPPRGPAAGLLGDAPPEAYKPEAPPARWPGDGLLGEAPPEDMETEHGPPRRPAERILAHMPSEVFEPEHRPSQRSAEGVLAHVPPEAYESGYQPSRRSAERFLAHAPPEAYEQQHQPSRRSAERLMALAHSEAYEYESHPPPPRWKDDGLQGMASYEAHEHNPGFPPPPRRLGDGLLGEAPAEDYVEDHPPRRQGNGLLGHAPPEAYEGEEQRRQPGSELLGLVPPETYKYAGGEGMEWQGYGEQGAIYKEEGRQWKEQVEHYPERRRPRPRPGPRPPPPREEVPHRRGPPPLLTTPAEHPPYSEPSSRW